MPLWNQIRNINYYIILNKFCINLKKHFVSLFLSANCIIKEDRYMEFLE